MKIPEISIKAEPIFHLFGFTVTNSLLSTWIVLILFVGIALYYYHQSQQKKRSLVFYLLNTVFKAVYSLLSSITKDKADVFFPILGSFFFFIILLNWFGLLPGVGTVLVSGAEEGGKMIPLLRGGNADLNTTVMLGALSIVVSQYYGFRYLGWDHVKKYLNFTNPIAFYVGILEIVSEFSRVASFSFRLFGNIFAGEVLLVVIASLVPILVSFPFLMMEIFVGFIQALVFALLSAVIFSMNTQKHH
ncbi:F0F1 ATP synthase subunit A [Candidatus Roizmanbacteria bacterium]|nr:F0F1 ATP synthase subunit A [Candidatus Roizmanbacteria bacterium]